MKMQLNVDIFCDLMVIKTKIISQKFARPCVHLLSLTDRFVVTHAYGLIFRISSC